MKGSAPGLVAFDKSEARKSARRSSDGFSVSGIARLPYPDDSELLPSVAAELAQLPPMNMLRAMARGGELFGPWRQLGSALLNHGELPPLLRELAILRVAALSPGADYEQDQHEAIARQLGMSEELIGKARTGAGLEGEEALVAAFTEEVVRDCSPSEATWQATVEHFSPRQIIELLTVIGHYMCVARVGATLRMEADPPVGTALFAAMRREPGD